MITEQFKIGIALMIEAGVRPVFGIVAGLTLFPVATFVVVIGGVATKAASWRTWKCSVLVTIQTNSLAMLTQQRILGFVVIKLGFKPLSWLVAGATLGTHDFLVGLIFKVTIDTLGGRFPVL